eukprot:1482875-Amphidinium_carterae.1
MNSTSFAALIERASQLNTYATAIATAKQHRSYFKSGLQKAQLGNGRLYRQPSFFSLTQHAHPARQDTTHTHPSLAAQLDNIRRCANNITI